MSTYCNSTWQHGIALRGRFGMPAFDGAALFGSVNGSRARLAATAGIAAVAVDVTAAAAPKRTPGTLVWSPPT